MASIYTKNQYTLAEIANDFGIKPESIQGEVLFASYYIQMNEVLFYGVIRQDGTLFCVGCSEHDREWPEYPVEETDYDNRPIFDGLWKPVACTLEEASKGIVGQLNHQHWYDTTLGIKHWLKEKP